MRKHSIFILFNVQITLWHLKKLVKSKSSFVLYEFILPALTRGLNYSRTSMTWTLLARLPPLFRTRSWVSWKNSVAADLGKLRLIFFFILKMVCCLYSLVSPQWGNSNENTQNTFMLKKIDNISLFMSPDLALWLTLISSNFPCLEHIFMVPKVFEPLKFYCISYQR